MLHIQRFIVNMVQENCYIVHDETLEGVIVDCGAYYFEEKEAIRQYVQEKNLRITHLLDTHLHFDHVFGNEYLFNKMGLEPEASDRDLPLYEHMEDQVADFLGMEDFNIQLPPLKRCLDDGDEVRFGTHRLQVLSVPGHTPGGLCFYCPEEKVLFTGDSLFRRSIGRTDFPGGDFQTLLHAVKTKLMTLPDEVKVLPGHSLSTTIGQERKTNPYVGENSNQ